MEPEDDYRYARRRAKEGAQDEVILRELGSRGVDSELAAAVLRGVRQERRRWNGSLLLVLVGAAILAGALFLLWYDARRALATNALPFPPTVAKSLAVVGGAVMLKGLFG